MQYKLRPYQEECVEIGINVLTDKRGRKDVMIASTSSGKSLIIGRLQKD